MERVDEATIIDERLAELRERHPGFPDRNAPFDSLAKAIVWCTKAPAEARVLEASSGPRRPMADVLESEQRLVSAELDRAHEAAADLERGLRLARSSGASELTLDSRDPTEDRLAGALISILVASDLATVRTDDLGNEQYRYHVAVNWPALDAMAERIGLASIDRLLGGRPA